MKEIRMFDAILHTKGQALRMIYALFCQTSSFKLWQTKMMEYLSGEDWQTKLEKKLLDEVEKLTEYSDEELQLLLLLEILDVLGIEHYTLTKADYNDLAKLAEERAVSLLKQEDENFTGHTIEQLIQYQLIKRLRLFDEIFEPLEENAKEHLLTVLKQFLQQVCNRYPDLGEVQALKQKSLDDLKTMIEQQGMVNVFYVSLQKDTTLLFTGELMTFLDRLYEASAELKEKDISILAVQIMSGIDSYSLSHLIRINAKTLFNDDKDQPMQELLLPVIITALVLSHVHTKEEVNLEPLLKMYDDKFTQYTTACKTLIKKQSAKEKVTNYIEQMIQEAKQYRKDYEMWKEKEQTTRQMIRDVLEQTPLTIRHRDLTYTSIVSQLRVINDERRRVLEEEEAKKGKGVVSWVGKTIDRMEEKKEVKRLEKERTRLLDELVQIVIDHDIMDLCQEELTSYKESVLKQEEFEQKENQAKTMAQIAKKELTALEEEIEILEATVTRLSNEYRFYQIYDTDNDE